MLQTKKNARWVLAVISLIAGLVVWYLWPVWVYDYQALIVGLGGFAGIIYTLDHNARLARDQRHDEECEREKERLEEQQSIRAALIEELRFCHRCLEVNNRNLDEYGGGTIIKQDMVFKSLLSRISILPGADVRQVMIAYSQVEMVNAAIIQAADSADGKTFAYLTKGKYLPKVTEIMSGATVAMAKAIAHLEESQSPT